VLHVPETAAAIRRRLAAGSQIMMAAAPNREFYLDLAASGLVGDLITAIALAGMWLLASGSPARLTGVNLPTIGLALSPPPRVPSIGWSLLILLICQTKSSAKVHSAFPQFQANKLAGDL
jgi:hypothetical protein